MPPPPAAAAGVKVVRSKTVKEVMGLAFNPIDSIRLNSPFTKKMMKYATREFCTEHVMFLLVAEEFKKQPTLANLAQIAADFVTVGSPREINIQSSDRSALQEKIWGFEAIAANPNMRKAHIAFNVDIAVLDSCVAVVRALLKRDTMKRLESAQFDTAFTLSAQETRRYEADINFLKSDYQIVLM